MKKKTKILIIVLALIVLVAILIYMRPSKEKEVVQQQAQNPPINGGLNIGTAAPVASDAFPLNVGSKGTNVKTLQQALNRINEKTLGNKYTPLKVDGDLGPNTYNAIVTWAGSIYWGPSGLSQANFTAILQKSNSATTPITSQSVPKAQESDTTYWFPGLWF